MLLKREMQKLNFQAFWLPMAAKQITPKQWLKGVTTILLFVNVRADWAQLGSSHWGVSCAVAVQQWLGQGPLLGCFTQIPGAWQGLEQLGSSGPPLPLPVASPHRGLEGPVLLCVAEAPKRNLQKLCDLVCSGFGCHVVSLPPYSVHRRRPQGHNSPSGFIGRGSQLLFLVRELASLVDLGGPSCLA